MRNKVEEKRGTGQCWRFFIVEIQVKRDKQFIVSWKSWKRCSSSTVSSLERVFVEVVEWLLRHAQTECASCRRGRRLLDSFQESPAIDPPDWSKCSHRLRGPNCLFFFLRNENDFHFRTGLLPSTRLPHHFFPIQTFINNLRRQCYVIKKITTHLWAV